MNLLYDASLLGIGHRNRTISGLIRTAEDLLFSIIETEAAEVTLCSSLSYEIWRHCLEYKTHNSRVARLGFVRQKLARHQVYGQLLKFVPSTAQMEYNGRGFLNRLLRPLFEMNFRPLQASDLDDIDIYHSPYHAFPRIVKQTRHIKRFLTVHDIIPIRHPEWFGLEKNFRAADLDKEFNLLQALNSIDRETWIICPSLSTKNDLCDYLKDKINPAKISVIPWAASNLFRPCLDRERITLMRRKYGIPRGPYVLSLSTLEPRKNTEHVIRCFIRLVEQEGLTDLCLVLAGALGWDYQPVFREIDRFNQGKKRIILTGYIAEEDIAALYSEALVFVYPSFYEGFGLPPLEAMQCGTPVITSNTSSLPEVVGNAGITLNALDGDGLCQSMLKIYCDLSLRDILSKKSVEQARRFSWSASAEQTMSAYRCALA